VYWILSHKKQRNCPLETQTKQWGTKQNIWDIRVCPLTPCSYRTYACVC